MGYMYLNVIITIIVNFPSSGLCNVENSGYLGCWPMFSLVVRNSEVNVTGNINLLQTCKDNCHNNGYSTFILIQVLTSSIRRCDCADFVSSPSGRFDLQCVLGSPLYSGSVDGMYAVYSTAGNLSGSTQSSSTSENVGSNSDPSSFITTTSKTVSSASSSSATECNTGCDCTFSQIISLTFDDLTPEQQEEILDMKRKLQVNKKELSSFIRSKTSAKDDRPTAKGIGSIGIIMLVLSAAVILLMDSDKIIIGTNNWIKFFKSMRYSANKESSHFDKEHATQNIKQ